MMGGGVGMEGRKCRWRRRDREVRLQLWGVDASLRESFVLKDQDVRGCLRADKIGQWRGSFRSLSSGR